MNIYDFPPLKALISAAYWVVTALSDALEPLAGGASAALAVILLTVLVRILLIPVGRAQVKAAVTRQRLAPRIAELQRKHAKQPEVLQRKTMELYSAEKASPFAGCLPVLAQMPVLMAVYGIFIHPRIDGEANTLLEHSLLGVPLGDSLFGQIAGGTAGWATAAVFLTVVAVVAVVAQASRRMLAQSQQPQSTSPQQRQPRPAQQPGMPDLTRLTRVLSFMPFMTAVVAVFVPLAAGLYLMTTTAWTLGERLVLTRIYRAKDDTGG